MLISVPVSAAGAVLAGGPENSRDADVEAGVSPYSAERSS